MASRLRDGAYRRFAGPIIRSSGASLAFRCWVMNSGSSFAAFECDGSFSSAFAEPATPLGDAPVNRQYVGGESPLQTRTSHPVWLRVMGRREQFRRPSVDRRRHRLGIEPRKGLKPERRESPQNSKATLLSAIEGECEAGSAGSETPSMCGNIMHGNRESPWSPVEEDGETGRVGKSKDARR